MPNHNAEHPCLIVADGEVLVRNVISDYLRECGYKVIEAANTDEVIAVLNGSSEKISGILSDASLAGSINAFQLRIWTRENYPEVRTILAGTIDTESKAAGELCDEGPHLKRPYDPQAVLAHIKKILAAAKK